MVNSKAAKSIRSFRNALRPSPFALRPSPFALRPSPFAVCGLITVILMQGGCYPQGGLASNLPTSGRVTQSSVLDVLVDVGVVFSDSPHYFCIPFECMGLSDGMTVRSIASSCDCVNPTVIDYLKANGQAAKALKVLIQPESQKGEVSASINLAVTITLDLAGHDKKTVTFRFLHTILADHKPQS